MTSTTIRVPRELHDRLAEHAAAGGTTLAGAIENALEAEENAAFWAAVRTTMGSKRAAVIRSDTQRLSGTVKDGLDPDESWDDIL